MYEACFIHLFLKMIILCGKLYGVHSDCNNNCSVHSCYNELLAQLTSNVQAVSSRAAILNCVSPSHCRTLYVLSICHYHVHYMCNGKKVLGQSLFRCSIIWENSGTGLNRVLKNCVLYISALDVLLRLWSRGKRMLRYMIHYYV